MKRKRGPKASERKGKRTEKSVDEDKSDPNFVSVNAEDTMAVDDIGDGQPDSKIESGIPSTVDGNTNQSTYIDVNRINDRPSGKSGHGRVRVKLRSSKSGEHNLTSSEAHTHSDTDKSNSLMAFEKHGEGKEKIEDSVNSLPDTQADVSAKSSRKLGIKIKSSKGVSLPDKHINKENSLVQVQCERIHGLSENKMNIDLSAPGELYQRETNNPHLWERHRDRHYNAKELSAALAVIKKIMKMDAAEPFNAPVNPVALGIPDYFEIIDTPMDFGTICNDLEFGKKYMNSEDVFKDVQFIWENCYRYNNKGDYILDLMKRVKKNFTKYWVAAGLYCEPSKRSTDLDQASGILGGLPQEDDHGRERTLEEATGGKSYTVTPKQETVGSPSLNWRPNVSDSIHVDGVALSSQENLQLKGNYSKQKTRRSHGRHKSNCLCAICIAKRRRQERTGKAQVVEEQTRTSDAKLMDELKHEESNLSENPSSEDADSENPNLEHAQEPEADAEVVGIGVKPGTLEVQESFPRGPNKNKNEPDLKKNGEHEPIKLLLDEDGSGDESNQQPWEQEMEESGSQVQPDGQKDARTEQPEEEATDKKEEHQQEGLPGRQHCTVYENPLHPENPSILRMCGTLFPGNSKSIWSGPHSLSHRHVAVRDNPFDVVLTMFMK